VDYSIAGQIERCGGDETCLTAVALEYESPAICEGFGFWNEAYEKCYTQLAVKYRNAGYCNTFYGYERDDCVAAVAASGSQSTTSGTNTDAGTTSEESTTQTIPREYTVPEQIEMCREMVTSTEQMNCMIALAVNYEMPSLCEEIPRYNQNNCYAQLAIRYNKPQYCRLLPYAEEIELCMDRLG